MDDLYRHNPARTHYHDKRGQRAGRNDYSKYVAVSCRVLLVPVDGYFSGGASIRANCQSQVIGWRDIFYEQSVPKKIIVPIKKKAERILQGTASRIYDGSTTTAFSDPEQRKLKLMKEKIRELLKTEELEKRKISSNFIGTLKREFDESYLEMVLNSKKQVLYSNLELRLPLL